MANTCTNKILSDYSYHGSVTIRCVNWPIYIKGQLNCLLTKLKVLNLSVYINYDFLPTIPSHGTCITAHQCAM